MSGLAPRPRVVRGLRALARLAICIGLAALVAACATLPPGTDAPKTLSVSLVHPEETRLGRELAARAREHPGLSGLRLLPAPLEAFRARIAMARAAEKTLDVQYYVIQNDNTGQLFLRALLEAADRGVRVRMLVDDTGTIGRQAPVIALTAHPNIEFRVFNPFVTRSSIAILRYVEYALDSSRLAYRMHNKLIVADNAYALTGGRNIGDEYFAASDTVVFGDDDALIAGPLVPQLSRSFDAYWNSTLAVPIEALNASAPARADLDRYRLALDAHREAMRDSDYVQQLRDEGPSASVIDPDALLWAKAEAIYDSPDKARVENGERAGTLLRRRLEQAIASVQSEFLLVSPYLVPGDEGMRIFTTLRKRDVRVRVLTNSLASTDAPIVNAGYDPYRVPLLEAGVELYEVKPVLGAPATGSGGSVLKSRAGQFSLHAKVFVLDRKRVFVGSMNFDNRSFQLNTEMGILIDSADIARSVAARFEGVTKLANSYRLFLADDSHASEASVRWRTEVDGKPVVYERDPEAAAWRRFIADALGKLPIQSEL